jgi:hypothetical protein
MTFIAKGESKMNDKFNDEKFVSMEQQYRSNGFLMLSESETYKQMYRKDSDGNIDLVFYELGTDDETQMLLLANEIRHLYKIVNE